MALAVSLAACSTAPLRAPEVATGEAYKEAPPGWMDAAPADLLERGAWWTLFQDGVLDDLVRRVEVSNQTVAAAAAAYSQARELVREQRAGLFPNASLDASSERSGGRSSATRDTTHRIALGASWEPDVWGRVSGTVGAARASAQASAADLAAARLSAQAELVTDYLSLRETDAESELLRTTIGAYERSARSTRNRYDAGIAPKSDVLQAQTQLANARADLAGLERQRAQLEHAIAVLVGDPPSRFSMPTAPWRADVMPAVPPGLPSALLQRRPDIAAAERLAAAANARIGVERAAFFPALTLSGSYGLGATTVSSLFDASAAAWSLGASLAQVLFDAGARNARVAEARASWEQSVAQYRQTVLQAFQDVEDQITAVRILEQQQALRREASEAADQTEQQVMNRYNAGQVSYTEVVTAQVSALSARRAMVQATVARQTAAVSLIRALGGGWSADRVDELARR